VPPNSHPIAAHRLCLNSEFVRVKCVAVCCSVLQCIAVCCSVLQCVAVCYKCVAHKSTVFERHGNQCRCFLGFSVLGLSDICVIEFLGFRGGSFAKEVYNSKEPSSRRGHSLGFNVLGFSDVCVNEFLVFRGGSFAIETYHIEDFSRFSVLGFRDICVNEFLGLGVGSFAKETYLFEEPSNRSHPTATYRLFLNVMAINVFAFWSLGFRG